MKAVVLTAYGDVNKLEVTDVPDPEPGPGQIKVRMAGASINPVDWKLIVPIVKKLPLAQAREAQTLAEHHAGGKVILRG
jgi:NADPH:quinone reductase-like Zn-dependent oxidoreductase